MRLQTEDGSWAVGEGPVVTGSAGDLALLLTGRTASALPRLHGAGVGLLLARQRESVGAG